MRLSLRPTQQQIAIKKNQEVNNFIREEITVQTNKSTNELFCKITEPHPRTSQP